MKTSHGIQFEIIRSDRRTVEIQISIDGCVKVRAPKRMKDSEILRFVEQNEARILKHIEAARERSERLPAEPTEQEKQDYIARAKKYIPLRVEYYAGIMKVTPTGITITSARTRHGSCSPKNRLSFSWRLMSYPDEAIDYVVVHELAHIRYHNHSPAFYNFIASVMPDHKERRAMLKI